MAGIGKYKKGAKFKLRSGNRTPFKSMGSSPLHQDEIFAPDLSGSSGSISSQINKESKRLSTKPLTQQERINRFNAERSSRTRTPDPNYSLTKSILGDKLGGYIDSKELGLLHFIFPGYQKVYDTRVTPHVKIDESKQEIKKEASTLERRDNESDESYNKRKQDYQKSIETKGDQGGKSD